MVKIELRGIAKVTAKGKTYYYAWRGGPRLCGVPGSIEFVSSYNDAIEDRRTLDGNWEGCRDAQPDSDSV